MKNYQNPFAMNPNMANQQGMVLPPQQGMVPGTGFGPMNIPQGGYPYPVQQQMTEEDCGCGHDEEEAVLPAGYNPYGPGMAPNMMVPHGPHGPGCTCGHQQAPMTGPGMMGGFGPQVPGAGPMMGGFGGPAVAPSSMGGFGPQGPGNPGMMAPQGYGMAPNMMPPHGPHGPGCTCGVQHGQIGGPGMMGGFGPQGR